MSNPPANRLSIAHLMLWTLGSAVILAFYRATDLRQNSENAWAVVMLVNALLGSLLLGAEVGGLVLFVWRKMRGAAGFPTQPGHWILLIEGVSALLVWTGQAGAFVMSQGRSASGQLWATWQIPNCLISGAAYLLLLGVTIEPRRWWKPAYLVLSLQYFISLWMNVTYGSSSVIRGSALSLLLAWLRETIWSFHTNYPPLVAIGMIALAAWQDAKTHHRDFLHWTGIVTLLGTQLLMVALNLIQALVLG